jgi:hypothetical protein
LAAGHALAGERAGAREDEQTRQEEAHRRLPLVDLLSEADDAKGCIVAAGAT